MTTLVYDHNLKAIFADGRETDHNGFICCDRVTKIFHCYNGDVLAGAGPSDVIDYVVTNWDARAGFGADTDLALMLDNSESKHAAFFLYDKESGKFYEYHVSIDDDTVFNVYQLELRYTYALGSGAAFAIAAIDLGCDAVGAIEYAATRDSCTGGKIESFTPYSKAATDGPISTAALPEHG